MLYNAPTLPWKSKALVAIAILIFLGLFVLRLLTGPGASKVSSSPNPVLHGPEVALGTVRASGAVERARFSPSERTSVWLTIKNTGEEPVQEVLVNDFESPGLETIGQCWRDGVPACASGTAPQLAATGGYRLEAGAQLTLWGELKAASRTTTASTKGTNTSDVSSMAATLTWQENEFSPPQPQALTLRVPFPRVHVHSCLRSWFAYTSDVLYQFVKDFAIPILVVVLGFVFQRMREREKAEHQMMPLVHESALRFYMPIVAAGQNFLDEFDKWAGERGNGTTPQQPPSVDVLNKMFFHLVKFYARIRAMSNEVGGFYLKSRLGEDMLALLWDLFRERLRAHIPYDRIEALVNRVAPGESIDQFLDRGKARPGDWFGGIQSLLGRWQSGEPDFEEVRKGFCKWLSKPAGELRHDIDVLRVFCKVLHYEMNLPYAFWYGDQEQKKRPVGADKIDALTDRKERDSPGTLQELKETAKKYF